MGYYQLNQLSVCHLWPLWENVSLKIRLHMASYCCCYRLKMFLLLWNWSNYNVCLHKNVFAKIPCTCKYNTTSNCNTLLKIIEYIDIIISYWHTLGVFRRVNMYYVILKTNKIWIYITLLIIYIIYCHIS